MNPLSQQQHSRHELYRRIGVVTWVSFVAACIATAVFFAIFDPMDILDKAAFVLDWSRMTSYGIGFFLFWGLTSATGAMVAWLICLSDPSVVALREQQLRKGQLESEEDAL